MSYIVLARKWRPKRFAEMVGQEHVLRALSNALDSGKVHHAFLFTGTRGVGKTTVARILAKSLNCETGVSSNPCGICAAICRMAAGSRQLYDATTGGAPAGAPGCAWAIWGFCPDICG